MENYYDILKISPTASAEEITEAIKRESRIWHTRTNAPKFEIKQQAEWMMKCLDEAENILLDTTKKAEYDRNLKSAPKQESEVDTSGYEGGEDLVALAWKLLSEGNVADALYVATKATEQQGNNPDAWALLGQAKYQWGETEDAIYEYKRAIQLKPNEAFYYYDLGSIYESMERWEEALKQYQRASQIEPGTSMYRAAIAGIFVRHGMYREGVEIMEQCVKEEPTNKSYQWLLAVAYHEGMLNTWWKNPEDGMFYCISKEQADNAKAILDKIKTLDFEDHDLKKTIRETEELIDKMYARKFVGSWILVGIYCLFYVIPGVLWWFINRRTGYMINKDIHDLVTSGKMTNTTAAGEAGVYYSALPPGFKWAATSFPRFVVWGLMIVLSPISFLYNAYNNYRDDKRVFGGLLAAMVIAVIGIGVLPNMLKGKFGGNRGYSQNQQGTTSYITKGVNLRSGPGSKAGQVGKLSRNTQVSILGSTTDNRGEVWNNVRVESGPLQGRVGYVKTKYVNSDGSSQAAIPSSPAAPAVPAQNLPAEFSRDRIKNMLDNFLHYTNTKNYQILDMYADRVNTFNGKTIDKSSIRKDEDNYFSRWDTIKFDLVDDFVIIDADTPNRKKVEFRFNYQLDNAQKSAFGTSQTTWIIESQGGQLKIVDQKERIISRNTNTAATNHPPTTSNAGGSDIESTVRGFYQAVQDKRVGDAVNMFSSAKKPNIKVKLLQAVAKDTEYYVIDSISITNNDGSHADTVVRLRHKKFRRSEENWEINVSLVNEDGGWKIVSTPGRKI